MKGWIRIPLSQGKSAAVDLADFFRLTQWSWCVNAQGYATRRQRSSEGSTSKMIRMHRVIAGTPDGLFTDHINGDRLDNRSENLRVCDTSQNLSNRGMQANNKSGYKGVSWHSQAIKKNLSSPWVAKIKVKNKQIYIGAFKTAKEAAVAYEEAAKKYHGEFACV